MEKETKIIAIMALQFLYGLNTKVINQIASLEDPQDYFKMSAKERTAFLKKKGIETLQTNFDPEVHLARAREWYRDLKARGVQFLTREDPAYPANLEQRHDPEAPTLLYVLSKTPAKDLFKDKVFLGVVGTRDPSPYGIAVTTQAVADLATLDPRPVIVSGLALGVDARAHRTALANGIPTIAVLPTGVDTIYPIMHRDLADQIANTPGCALITDYPPQTAPIAINCLRRNRIIAALGDVLLVPESKQKGGAMMTARLAAERNRDVYAIPGRITDPRSAGCNDLIRCGVAELLSDTTTLTRLCKKE